MNVRSFGALVLGIGLSCSLRPAFVLAADPTGSFEIKPVGTPLGSTTPPNKPLMLKVTLIVKGKPVTKDVAVSTIKAFETPRRDKDEPLRDYAKRVLEKEGEASHAKAQAIADEINKAFNLTKPEEKAGAGFTIVKNRTIKVDNVNVPGLEALFGSLVIQGVTEKQGNPLQIVEPGLAGEGRNGGNFVPRPRPRPSSGAKVSMGRAFGPSFATGFDPLGEPSLVEFGFDDQFIATVMPREGMSDLDVLMGLQDLLETNGIPATYDSTLMELFLDAPLPDGHTLIWGNTDVGLDFRTSFESLGVVPEPASALLMATGFMGLLASADRRRRNRGRHA
ncbi:MAG: hypothetical protein HYZ89_08220 [Candidatus Omnitrophica bacterium]|nr:hypothetical protein [Candidatus Omnitrophota bacterium]